MNFFETAPDHSTGKPLNGAKPLWVYRICRQANRKAHFRIGNGLKGAASQSQVLPLPSVVCKFHSDLRTWRGIRNCRNARCMRG